MLASRFSSSRVQVGTRSNEPLSDGELRRVVPSIFAEGAHESRSARYTYIPTIDILNALRDEGFQPFQAVQTRVRDQDKREHAKHMLRLRHVNHAGTDATNEIILLNSHDGSSSYQMLAGVFRFVCANGLIVGDTHHDIRIPHKGNIIDAVVNGAHDVLDGFDLITEKRERLEAVTLSRAEQAVFAEAALTVRYGDDLTAPAPISAQALLQPRRREDTATDLWSTLNRVQENVMRGGLIGRNAKNRSTTTRPVSSIDQNVKLNRALWLLAERMDELKG